MSFLSKIKYEYHFKLLEDFFKSKEYSKLLDHLGSLSSQKSIFFSLANHYIPIIFKEVNQSLYDPKNIWFNTYYYTQNTTVINNFMELYFANFYPDNWKIENYDELLKKTLAEYTKGQSLTTDFLIQKSYLLQWLLSFKNSFDFVFLQNQFPFFSTADNYNFTNSNFTKCYFHFVEHPYRIYSKLKISNSGDQHRARNSLLNLDGQILNDGNSSLENKLINQGWTTHTQSWIDSNVSNSLRGKLLKLEDFEKDPYEFFTEMIIHLIQSGIKIELNYEYIEEIISNKKITKNPQELTEISNKEKKFIANSLEGTCSILGYEL